MSPRRHLTYANVLATLTLFAVLAGGTAIAAGQLGANSVGSKQLKKNAVTAAKLKKNAVTTAKLAMGAVTGAKVKAGSVQGVDLSPKLPYGQILHSARGSSSLAVPPTGVIYPLEGGGFTQEAGVSVAALGGVEFSVPSGCGNPAVFGAIIADRADPLAAFQESQLMQGRGVIAEGEFEPEKNGPLISRLTLSPTSFDTAFGVAPSAPATHSLALAVAAECQSGSGTITASFGGIDVIANGEV